MSQTQDHDIVKLLTCPKCSKYIKPPSAICENGHVVCGTCKEEQCVVCSTENFSNKNNYQFDFLLKEVLYPCKHQQRGCQSFVSYNKIYKHEAKCEYQEVSCRFDEDGCMEIVLLKDKKDHEQNCEFGTRCQTYRIFNGHPKLSGACNWIGNRSELKFHISQTHNLNLYVYDNIFLGQYHTVLGPLYKTFTKCDIVKIKGTEDIFYFYVKHASPYFYFALKCVGEDEKASHFLYTVKLEIGKKKLLFTSDVLPASVDMEAVFDDPRCFVISDEVLKKIFFSERLIEFLVKITKRNGFH